MPCPTHFDVSGNSFCIFHLPNNAKCAGLGVKDSWGEEADAFLAALTSDYVDICVKGDQLIDFTDVHFPFELALKQKQLGKVDFSRVFFLDGCEFRGTKFLGRADFVESHFLGFASFDYASFVNLDCSGSVFHGPAEFRNAEFREKAIFCGCKFRSAANFVNSKSWATYFDDATFHDLLFKNAEIRDAAIFSNAEFKGYVFFDETEIGGITDFSSSTQTTLGGAHRLGRDGALVSFRNVQFGNTVSFENRNFITGANFRDAIFSKVPIFHGCDQHQDITFPTRSNFLDSSADSANAYTYLKLSMGKMKRSREEGMFYALEQKCLRKDPDTPRSAKIASWIYEKVSDYGQSFLRPLNLWFGLPFLFYLLYLAATWDSSARMSDILSFAVKQSVFPFSAWRVDLFEELSIWNNWQILGVRVLASIQSAVSLGLIAMSLLALRWRFRRT
jgi:uncharacterized protein YjbI with pentapeptide repeats